MFYCKFTKDICSDFSYSSILMFHSRIFFSMVNLLSIFLVIALFYFLPTVYFVRIFHGTSQHCYCNKA